MMELSQVTERMSGQADGDARISGPAGGGMGAYSHAGQKQLSLLGGAMAEEVRVASQSFRSLLDRIRHRGFCEGSAMNSASKAIEEAEMWALRSISQL